MKTAVFFIAFIVIGKVTEAQNSPTPNPPGNGYGLYHHFSNITVDDVEAYLVKTGHTVLDTPRTEDAGKIWHCTTRKEDGHTYHTVVYTDGENIVGFDDTILD